MVTVYKDRDHWAAVYACLYEFEYIMSGDKGTWLFQVRQVEYRGQLSVTACHLVTGMNDGDLKK